METGQMIYRDKWSGAPVDTVVVPEVFKRNAVLPEDEKLRANQKVLDAMREKRSPQ